MKKKISIKNITLAALLLSLNNAQAVSNRGFRSDMSFLDFEDITEKFHRKAKQSVHIIRHEDSPVQILNAEVKDKGTVFFSGLTGAQNTYTLDVKNLTNRDILAYEVTWVLKHPFEDYVFHKMYVNSISPLKAGTTQELKFRRNKHYRDDAYFYVEISKVEFEDDESVWEAPDIDKYKRLGPIDKVKEEIDAMKDSNDLSNPDSIDLDALKKDLEKLENQPLQIDDSDVKNKVELQEIKNETLLQPVEEVKTETIDKVITPAEEIKTTTEIKTETSTVKETEIVKEAATVKEADVIKETEVMKETQVLNKNQSDDNEDEDFDYEDEDFDFDEDEDFEFDDEDSEEEF